MISQHQETVFVVSCACAALKFTQVIAAFTDRADADEFIGQQDRRFTFVVIDGESVWLPDRVIAGFVADQYRELAIPPWSAEHLRCELVFVIHELPWNQLIGRLVPRTVDGHPGPTLVPQPGATTPSTEPIDLRTERDRTAKPRVSSSGAGVAYPPSPNAEERRQRWADAFRGMGKAK